MLMQSHVDSSYVHWQGELDAPCQGDSEIWEGDTLAGFNINSIWEVSMHASTEEGIGPKLMQTS